MVYKGLQMQFRDAFVEMKASLWVMTMSIAAVKVLGRVPSGLKVCGRDDPSLNECLKDAVQQGIRAMAGGLNEGDVSVPPLDPYTEDLMTIDFVRNQISGKAVMKETVTSGLLGATVKQVRADLSEEAMHLEIDMYAPEIFVEGYFESEGRFNAITVNTKGRYNNTMNDVTWTYKLYGKAKRKDGRVYMRVFRFSMRPDVGDMKIALPVLFENNPQLDEIAKRFAQDHWRIVYRELLPTVEAIWDKVGTKMANKIFMHVPYDELFPPQLP